MAVFTSCAIQEITISLTYPSKKKKGRVNVQYIILKKSCWSIVGYITIRFLKLALVICNLVVVVFGFKTTKSYPWKMLQEENYMIHDKVQIVVYWQSWELNAQNSGLHYISDNPKIDGKTAYILSWTCVKIHTIWRKLSISSWGKVQIWRITIIYHITSLH